MSVYPMFRRQRIGFDNRLTGRLPRLYPPGERIDRGLHAVGHPTGRLAVKHSLGTESISDDERVLLFGDFV